MSSDDDQSTKGLISSGNWRRASLDAPGSPEQQKNNQRSPSHTFNSPPRDKKLHSYIVDGTEAAHLERIVEIDDSSDDEDAPSSPPPDGGTRAWSAAVAGQFVFMSTWGWINSFGVFQTYYKEILDRPASDISWIGSIGVFLHFFVGTMTGRLVDAGHFRKVFATGIIIQAGGIFATSTSTSYWQLMLAQGVCVGIGNGCLFCPILAVLSTYFAHRRALAMGFAACGSVTGGLIFPSLVREMLPTVGFAWTLRTVALIQVVSLSLALALAKPRIKPRVSAPLIDLAAFRELEYTFYTIGCYFAYFGIYFAFYYITSFSRDAFDKPLSYTESLTLLIILNGVGIIGRLLPAWLADNVGIVNVFIPCTIAASMLIFCWISVENKAGLYSWAVVYGPIAAAIQSLFPTGVALLTQDISKIGVRMGMSFTIVSFAVLTGPPITGAIIERQGGKVFWGAQLFAGTSLATGTLFLIAAKMVRMQRTGQGWTAKI
ncbi:major facilitator superfamily domain-containing protein [Dactylonectria estremocensis]|uniref:Major facilitator superfamily domain-containing protein n=1 Tax=Dactylonectria estremocensis TaxID=1079267 RepID=A0A9P9E0U8_9HYPO|nr:major facilitator superfamily domain-containing protein [Dactylonectria estremocensis]